jgi:ATP-binding cassette subfamily E protein 1
MESRKRIAVIAGEKCNFDNCGNYLCEKMCPVNRNGRECIIHEPKQKPVISEELCIGCEICQNRCPFGAISIVNLSFDLANPFHSYGKNAFRLYGFSEPKKNSVVGIIGRNGVGKSTMIKILSAELTPNFGNFSLDKNPVKEKEIVLEKFRGKSALTFFKELYAGMKVAVKPQSTDSSKAKGLVEELLRKVDSKNAFEKIVNDLALENLLKREVSTLSGGEFQKVAIAATLMKEGGLYFFDEPSSFLDIKERLRCGHAIKELTENSSVMVVEHDLILLDYLSDYINLVYGKPGIFGFVSNIKTSREGINDYLEGYSKDENYRFRTHKVDFFSSKTEKKQRVDDIISWTPIKKKLGTFELNVSAGSIKRNDVVGIVGTNGIGKTTFMRMLAGELIPDEGTISSKVTISYKPQMVVYTGEKTVGELVSDCDQALLRELELEKLLEHKAKNISGGELQRLSIAICLSKKADLYLLDEPSAHLDIEQRLAVAKAIRSYIDINDKSAFVIDHDLSFIDYISDRSMTFLGEPAIHGNASGPFEVKIGINSLLKELNITVRRDPETKRPRINKRDSVLDREQKAEGKYYA